MAAQVNALLLLSLNVTKNLALSTSEEFPKKTKRTDSYRNDALIETNDKLSLHAELLSSPIANRDTIGAQYL